MFFKRVSGVATLAAAIAVTLAAGLLAPGEMAAAQDGRTPEQICIEATENLSEPATREFERAEEVLEDGTDYWAVLCTEQGPITIDLLEDVAPIAVNNFVFLAQQGYFNNTTFHRVLPGFMAQGGDPTATGTGGPGYQFEDEIDSGLLFDRPGLLAMANAGPNTNGSQFFITYVPTPWLNGYHTIFGRVYAGQASTELLLPRNPEQSPTYEGDALYTVVIVDDPASITVEPDEAPTFEHWQTLLQRLIGDQIGAPFVPDADHSRISTLESRAVEWGEAGGEELAAYMREYLAANDFMGAATIALAVEECPANPAELPFWSLRFEVNDYGNAESAAAVALDDARSDELVASGAFASYTDGELIGGRIYRRPVEGNPCGDEAALYRFEMALGRYVLAVESVLDETVVNADADVTPEQFLVYLLDQVLAGSLGGPLERGNLAD